MSATVKPNRAPDARVLLGLLAGILAVEGAGVALNLLAGQANSLVLVHVLLTVGLCWSTYHGSLNTRVLLVGLKGWSGAMLVWRGLGMLAVMPGSGLVFLLLGLLQLSYAVGLFALPQVRHYFKATSG